MTKMTDEKKAEVKGALDGLGDGPAPGGAPPPGPEVPPPSEEGEGIPPEQVARMVIDHSNTFLSAHGLTPLNPAQEMLLQVGIVGVAKKYKIRFSMGAYPEVALAAGAIWITADKVREYRAKQKPKPSPASQDPQGHRDVTPPPPSPDFAPSAPSA